MNLRRGKWFWIVLVVIVGLVAWGVRRFVFSDPPPPQVTTSAVIKGNIEEGVLATGTIEAARLVSVGAQVTGVLTKLHVALGDRVKKGQLIAEIDSITQQNDLRKAEAGVLNVRALRAAKLALLKQTTLAAARLKALVAIDAGSRADLEAADAQLATTKADIAALDAQLSQAQLTQDTAKVNVGYARVVAPIDGTVVAVVTEEGQTVNSAFSAPVLIKLAQLDTMTIKAQISEADVPRVHAGLPVYFTLLGDPDTRFDAVLKRVEPGPTTLATDTSASSTTATASSAAKAIYYNGIFEVPNPDGKLRIAMTAQVTIVVARVDGVLIVQSSALGAKDKDGRYKVRVKVGDRIEDRLVKIGLNNRVQAQVLDGLQAGDLVVTSEAAPPVTPGIRPR
ncbi:MAG: efflux RND transporter periplasmic adaptor subunit [Burkholderiaceae bacterium]